MKKFNLFTIAVLLALIATSCSKEDGRFSLVANQMRNNSKILMDDAYNGSWEPNEKVLLNNEARTITVEGTNSYYLSGNAPVSGTTYQAIYPYLGTTGADADGNVVSIVGNTMTITNLVVDFVTGGYKVMFPMASKSVTASSNSCRLLFDHITGALKLTLSKTSASSCNLSSIKVVTQSSTAVSPFTVNGVTAQWNVQGPSVPVGPIGGINGDQIVSNGCEMNFKLKEGDIAYKTFNSGSSVSFCIPMTVSNLNKISVIGYDENGKQVFTQTKDLGEEKTIHENIIYPIPTIEF